MKTPIPNQTAELLSARLARRLGLPSETVTDWTATVDGSDTVEISYEGVTYMPIDEFNEIVRECRIVVEQA